MEQPLVSIIIPTYNRVSLIKETIQSVLDQSYENWECIIVDDGSTDRTEKMIEENYQDNPKIKYIRRPQDFRKGASGSRNCGFKWASGQLIQWLDDDDLLLPDKLSIQVHSLLNKGFGYISMCSWSFISHDTIVPVDNIDQDFKPATDLIKYFGQHGSFVPPHCFLIPRRLHEKAGSWNESLTLNDDAEYMCRVFLESEAIINDPRARVFYRDQGQERLSTFDQSRLESLLESFQLMFDHLKDNGIHIDAYFHRKLFNLVVTQWKNPNSCVLFYQYKDLFDSIGIHFKRMPYYSVKLKLYQFFYPTAKKIFGRFKN